MPNFSIVRQNNVDENSFRIQKLISDFDVSMEHSNERFDGSIEFPDEWQIGMIVGGSGTGKSTIMEHLFADHIEEPHVYGNRAVIDEMPAECSVSEIEQMFYAVGFGSVPSWLKPYGVLSNGEKMRVDLARQLLTYDVVVFDEYTSVVDRQVAQVMSIAIAKALKKYPNKKFVAVGCHYDVVQYLQPDWLFDTNEMKQVFQLTHDQKEHSASENVQDESGLNLSVITI